MHKVVSYSYKTSREGAWHYWWLFITTTLHASLKLVVAMEVLEIQICVQDLKRTKCGSHCSQSVSKDRL